MEPVRYRPPDAMRWLEIGAGEVRSAAKRQGVSIVRREGQRTFVKDLRDAAGVLVDMGKSALADFAHTQALSMEYALYEDRIEVVRPTGVRTVPFANIRSIKVHGDRATIVLDQGSVTVRPLAYLSSGRIRVPLGWMRNGMEVPHHLLLDEIAARSGVTVEQV